MTPTKRGSLSEMMEDGKPCTLTTCSKNARATELADVLESKGTKTSILENLSTTTNNVDFPESVGSSVRKSIAMSLQGIPYKAIGYNYPLVAVVLVLVLKYISHAATYFLTLSAILGNQYSCPKHYNVR